MNPTNPVKIFQHNLLIAFRNFVRYKTTFFINLIGLSTGLVSVLFIYLWVSAELNVDSFHLKDRRLYQVMQSFHNPEGIETVDSSPALLAKALTEEMPDIEYAVTLNNGSNRTGILKNEGNDVQASGLYASRDFFNVFSYRLLQGSSQTVLADKNSIVLSESTAIALFGTTSNVIGKVVNTNHDLMNELFVVSGVFERPPLNSTMQFDFVISFDMAFSKFAWLNEWSADDARTYIVLKEGVDAIGFNEKIRDFLHSKPDRADDKLFLQHYSDRYLYGQFENGVEAGGRIAYVRLFTIVGVLLLIIASINFINLSTAQASRKMKEVGIKKAIGISRRILAIQFLTESVFITILSVVVALILFVLLVPQINEIIGKTLSLPVNLPFILLATGFVLFIGIASGTYPALYLSGFDSLTMLKGNLGSPFGEQWARRGLVIVQFTLSIIFIVGFVIVNKQFEFIQNKNLGYQKENVIHFNMRGNYDRETFVIELQQVPGVADVTYAHGGSIVELRGAGTGFSWSEKPTDDKIVFSRPQVGYNFIETLGIELLAGRTFSKDFSDEQSKLIVNEAAAKIIGEENIIGKVIQDGDQSKQIIGVVKNFNIKSLHEDVQPTIIRFREGGNDFMLRITTQNMQSTIEGVANVYSQFNSEYPFAFTFIEDEYKALYSSEQQLVTLSKYFTVMAILISSLGLFGLVSFTVTRRTKEICIRKILGASEFRVGIMLSGEFTGLVLIASVIALPVSYILASSWLDAFAFRIVLHGWYFVGAGLAALVIAWLTVSAQTIRAAVANPVKSLRSE